MNKIKAHTQMLFVDTLLTGLMSAVVLLTVYPLIRSEIPALPLFLLFSLLSALIVALMTRKVYVLPVLLFLGLAFFIILLFTGELSKLLSDARALLDEQSESNLRPIVNNIILFFSAYSISLIIFAIYRKLYTFFFPLIVGIASAIRLYFGGSEGFYAALVIIIFVIFISLSKSRGKAHAKLLSERIEVSRAYHCITAIILIMTVLISTFLIVPKDDGKWKSGLLVQTTRDVSSLLRLEGQKRPLEGIFDIRITGYQPLGNRMGGNIIPDHTIVMNIYTNTPTLLVGSYYDTYDGLRWYNVHGQTQFRYDALILRGERNRAFLDKLPVGNTQALDLYNRIVTHGNFRIYNSLFGRSVFHAGRVMSIFDTDFDSDLLSFNEQGELFLSGASRRGMNYKMETEFFDRARPRFDENVVELELLVQGQNDPYFDHIVEHYTHLPDTLPQDVYDLALQLTDAQQSPYQNARAIENWLSENCTYTLTPGTPPEDEDFVSYFLQTREGYCVYFASAMTVLARSIGLPARYVSGFSLSRSTSDRSYFHFVASNSSAHVWTEIYFEGIGWIPFDATEIMTTSALAINYELEETYYIIPQAQPSILPDSTDSIESDAIEDPPSAYALGLHILIYLLGLIFFGLLVAGVGRTIYLIKDNKLYRKINLNSKLSNEEKLTRLFKRSLLQLSLLGSPISGYETLNEYLERTHSTPVGEILHTAWQPVIMMKYADIEPSQADIESLYAVCIVLEKQIPKRAGFFNYLIRRIFVFH